MRPFVDIRCLASSFGGKISDSALDIAVRAIDGFPYLMQLVGYRAWRTSGPEKEITPEHVSDAAELARGDFINGVVKDSCAELSDVDMDFLRAMLQDHGTSKISDIAERMGKTPSYARVYRKRLEEQGIIGPRGRGKVGFELPYLREYLEESE